MAKRKTQGVDNSNIVEEVAGVKDSIIDAVNQLKKMAPAGLEVGDLIEVKNEKLTEKVSEASIEGTEKGLEETKKKLKSRGKGKAKVDVGESTEVDASKLESKTEEAASKAVSDGTDKGTKKIRKRKAKADVGEATEVNADKIEPKVEKEVTKKINEGIDKASKKTSKKKVKIDTGVLYSNKEKDFQQLYDKYNKSFQDEGKLPRKEALSHIITEYKELTDLAEKAKVQIPDSLKVFGEGIQFTSTLEKYEKDFGDLEKKARDSKLEISDIGDASERLNQIIQQYKQPEYLNSKDFGTSYKDLVGRAEELQRHINTFKNFSEEQNTFQKEIEESIAGTNRLDKALENLYIRKQTNYATNDTNSYTAALDKITNLNVRNWVDEDGNAQQSVTPIVDYDKLLKELLRTDKEIFEYEEKIKNTRGDTAPLQRNLDLVKREQQALEQIMSDLVTSDKHYFSDSQVQVIQEQRDLQEQIVKNNQASADSVKRVAAQEKVHAEAKKQAAKAGTEILKLDKEIYQIEQKILNSDNRDITGLQEELQQKRALRQLDLSIFKSNATKDQRSDLAVQRQAQDRLLKAQQQEIQNNKAIEESEKSQRQYLEDKVKAQEKAQAFSQKELSSLGSTISGNSILSTNFQAEFEQLKQLFASVESIGDFQQLKLSFDDLKKRVEQNIITIQAYEQYLEEIDKIEHKEKLTEFDNQTRQSSLNSYLAEVSKSENLTAAFQQDLIRLRGELSSIGTDTNGLQLWDKEFKVLVGQIKEGIQAEKEFATEQKKAAKEQAETKLVDTKTEGQLVKLRAIQDEVNKNDKLTNLYKKDLDDLENKLRGIGGDKTKLSQYTAELNVLSSKINSSKKDIEDFSKATSGIQINSIQGIESIIESINAKGLKIHIAEQFDDFIQRYQSFKAALQASPNGIISDKDKQDIITFGKEIVDLRQIAIDTSTALKQIAPSLNVEVLINRMDTWVKGNKKLSSLTKDSVAKLINSLHPGTTTITELSKMSKEFGNIQRSARAAGETGKTFFDIWKQGMVNVARYLSTFTSFYRIVGYIREAITVVKELDTALIDLRKTAQMTNSEFEQFYFDANKIAKQMGVTTKSIIEQAAAWSRLNKIGLLYGNV